ncbi:MAG: hypothetical protein JXR25_14425 [Pontiellaceae bacterium]|nr:hypothetical protein [Pontiellaceae bacterium]MBN2786015.1 hypothetical protein [Pontiellaceae bacterium]
MNAIDKAIELGFIEPGKSCLGFEGLLDWQISQYHHVVDGTRKDLSRERGRCLSWRETENIMKKTDLRSAGMQWRMEYCGLLCPNRNGCLIALHFSQACRNVSIHKAG